MNLMFFFSNDTFEPHEDLGEKASNDQTTMFLNKYLEDTNAASVANRLSEVIIRYELAKKISCSQLEDDEIDDEVINEEEYLQLMEEEKLSQVLTSKNSDTASSHLSALHSDISTDRCQKIEDCTSKDESDCMIIESRTQKKAKELIKKMQQICVAPGEYGKFVNWKEDLFIEEKSFPEKFPFGIGGF